MSEPIRFLTSFAQAVATMALYGPTHPARTRAVDASYRLLRELQVHEAQPEFSFLGDEVVYGQHPLREMRDWEWAARLAAAGVQRLEFAADVTRDEFESFLEGIVVRLALPMLDGAQPRPAGARSSGAIRFGALGIRGDSRLTSFVPEATLPTARRIYELTEEVATVEWMHEQVSARAELPLLEAESVVRSLAVAMHGDQEMLLPLLSLREFDEYTTTHSLNVSVLTMALAEAMGMGPRDVRAFGVAGLLHDLGKVRIPKEILTKPGKLTDAEWAVMRRHPQIGARVVRPLGLSEVVVDVVLYHHERWDGGGYPQGLAAGDIPLVARIFSVCDALEAMTAMRRYRDALPARIAYERVRTEAGTQFDPAIVRILERGVSGGDIDLDDPAGVESQPGLPRRFSRDGLVGFPP
jgi:putative nucleotidyltransferase with HDIG domain